MPSAESALEAHAPRTPAAAGAPLVGVVRVGPRGRVRFLCETIPLAMSITDSTPLLAPSVTGWHAVRVSSRSAEEASGL